MADQNQQDPLVARSSEDQFNHSTAEPTNLFSMLGLNGPNSSTATTGCDHFCCHAPCTPFGCCASNSMKRRSPSLQDPTGAAIEPHSEHRAKKLFRDHEDLNLQGFSSISFPLSFGPFADNTELCPVLRRCISDPCKSPAATNAAGFPATQFHSPEEQVNPRASGLIPCLKRCVSDPAPSPAKTFSRSSSSGVSLTKDSEASNSMRLRRMKDSLREMRKWWDEVLREEEDDDSEVAEGVKALSNPKDDCGEDIEEAVRVEWAEKCLSICFKCPCGKGYQILLSGNNCYYKLV